MFEFRQQPLKTLYKTYFVASVLFVRLPYWILTAVPSFLRPRQSWSFSRAIILPGIRAYVGTWFATAFPAFPGSDPELIASSPEAEKLGFTWVSALPGELIVEEIKEQTDKQGVKADKTHGYWYQRDIDQAVKDRKADANEKAILHFHGGGYVMGSAHPQGGAIGPVASGLLQHCGAINRIFAGGYRASSSSPFPSKNPWPAALLDALASYYYLIHSVGFSPENIIVSGDSAGGHLALALVRYTARAGLAVKGLPNPGALLLLSPTVEWGITHTGKDASMTQNKRSDFCEHFFKGYTQRSLVGSLPTSDAFTSPWISPASQQLPEEVLKDLFTEFPQKIYLLVGEAELCLDSYRTLKDRLVKGVGEKHLVYNEVPAATHDFITMEWHEPERTDALKDIAKWIDSL